MRTRLLSLLLLLLATGIARASVGLVQVPAAVNYGGVTTGSITFASPVTSGDYVIVLVTSGSSGAPTSVADSNSDTLQTILAWNAGATGFNSQGVYAFQAGTGGSNFKITVNFAASNSFTLEAFEVSGVGSTLTDAVSVFNTGTSTSPSAASLTPTVSGDLQVAFEAQGSVTSWSSGLTQQANYTTASPHAAFATQSLSSTSTVSASATLSASSNWSMVQFLIKAAPTAVVVGQAETSSASPQTSLAISLTEQTGDDFFAVVASGSPTQPVMSDSVGDNVYFMGAVTPQTGLYEYAYHVRNGVANSSDTFTANGTAIYGVAVLQMRGLASGVYFSAAPSRVASYSGTAFNDNVQAAPGAGANAITSTVATLSAQSAEVIGFTAIPGENGALVNAAPSAGTGFAAQTGVWGTWGGGAGDYLGVFETELVNTPIAAAATFTAPTYGSGAYGTFVWIVPVN